MLRGRLASACACATLLGSSGCAEEGGVDGTYTVRTAVAVDPELFLGSAVCTRDPGGVQTYVATLIDHGPSGAPYEVPFVLPSSPPTPCTDLALFRFVVPGHRYAAEIDAYDVGLDPAAGVVSGVLDYAAGEATCQAAPSSGSRQVCAAGAAGLEPLTPRWRFTCGGEDGSSGASAAAEQLVRVGACSSDGEAGPAGPAEIRVDPSLALGELGCAPEGAIATFDITPVDTSLSLVTLPCGGEPATFAGALTPGTAYAFEVAARTEASGPIAWGTRCHAVAKAGLSITATCDVLTDRGALSVSLAADGLACPADVTIFYVRLPEGAKYGPYPCAAVAEISGLLPGSYDLDVLAPGATDPLAVCSGDVTPARTVKAACAAP